MKKMMFGLSLLFFSAVMAVIAAAQDMVIYPAKGQSQERMEKDKSDCYSWAKQQSGFDPLQADAGSQAPPPSQPVGGERVRGAARGGKGNTGRSDQHGRSFSGDRKIKRCESL